LLFAAYAHVAAKLPESRKPGDEQNRGDGSRKLEQFCCHEARPRSMSIIAATGVKS